MKACRTCCGRKLTRPVVESQGGVVCATQRRVAAINLGGERRREGMPELAQLKVLRSVAVQEGHYSNRYTVRHGPRPP